MTNYTNDPTLFGPMPPVGSIVPMFTEETGRGERSYDIYSLLLKERILFVGQPIENRFANLIIAQLLVLDREVPHQPILENLQCLLFVWPPPFAIRFTDAP